MVFYEKKFLNLGHLEWHTPPKRHVALKVLTGTKVFYISKRALCEGTRCNNGLTYILMPI